MYNRDIYRLLINIPILMMPLRYLLTLSTNGPAITPIGNRFIYVSSIYLSCRSSVDE